MVLFRFTIRRVIPNFYPKIVKPPQYKTIIKKHEIKENKSLTICIKSILAKLFRNSRGFILTFHWILRLKDFLFIWIYSDSAFVANLLIFGI